MAYFYILHCKDGSLYSGYAKDLRKREREHNTGKGSKYVLSRGGGKIVYSEKLASVSAALKREAQIKRWTRSKKLQLIDNNKKK